MAGWGGLADRVFRRYVAKVGLVPVWPFSSQIEGVGVFSRAETSRVCTVSIKLLEALLCELQAAAGKV
jgi:hypothetical protein